jgi:hypothetical protein
MTRSQNVPGSTKGSPPASLPPGTQEVPGGDGAPPSRPVGDRPLLNGETEMEAPGDRPECASGDLYDALRMCGYTGPVDRYGRARSGSAEKDAAWNLRAVRRLQARRSPRDEH